MITGKAVYDVLAAIVPLYVAMILGYGSVKWWKIFNLEQCAGINRFVAVFAVPFLSFHFISTNDPYTMNLRFIAADTLQKVAILILLFLWRAFLGGSEDWAITLFSLSTLPNTLIVGIPLLTSMYGPFSASLMVQVVALQGFVWYTLLIIFFEYRSSRALISEQFPTTAASIASFDVDADVSSLSGREPLVVGAEIQDDGRLHVVVKRLSSSRRPSMMVDASDNLSGVEIYSVQSSRLSSFDRMDFHAKFGDGMASSRRGYVGNWNGELRSASASAAASSTWNVVEGMGRSGKRGGRSMSSGLLGEAGGEGCLNEVVNDGGLGSGGRRKEEGGNEGLHMFVWSSSASPASHAVSRPASVDFEASNFSKALVPQSLGASRGHGRSHDPIGHSTPITKSRADRETEILEDGRQIGRKFSTMQSPFLLQNTIDAPQGGEKMNGAPPQMPPASVMTRLTLIMVGRKLIRNPNTYASVIGLVWSLVTFRWKIEMPTIVKGSITIISNTGLGMAMFSLGLFMALQPKLIACGRWVAVFSAAVKFLVGPAVMAATSAAIRIRGVLLRVSILQAALPVGIVPFVFAKEYNCHAAILSTSVIFGLLITLPVTIIYYILLGL